MGHSFSKFVDASHLDKSIEDLLEASPSVLKGVTDADADALQSALGIGTVRELARNRHHAHARAILAASAEPGFDPGPSLDWATYFASAPLQHYLDHASGRFRREFGPVYYRGRLDGTARVLIVGQDPATDEILAHRAFVGSSGQRLQGLLKKLGVIRSYLMLNTFLFSVHDQFDDELEQISLEAPIKDWRNSTFDRVAQMNPIDAVIAVGRGAGHAVDQWQGASEHRVFKIVHPAAPADIVLPNWNQRLPELGAAITPDLGAQADLAPYAGNFRSDDVLPIPRFDLPFGVPDWHGTGGTRSRRLQGIGWQAPRISP